MNPSPRVSVCRSGRQHGGQGSHQHLARVGLWSQVGSSAGEVLSPAGQSLRRPMPREIGMVRSSPLGCGARPSQQWPGACLSYALRGVDSTLLGLLTSVLAPPMESGEFPQEPICGWSRSVVTAVLIPCANILGVSLCQTCPF